ncbi:MAG: type II toxin-antitoxin system Phd/YefM family antitoxin [Deltaproteobacteria bacterium]|nr:type II toxin-antitoxin system Phd/YefM family antitoxin [Deltaproteobacteria bacterium]
MSRVPAIVPVSDLRQDVAGVLKRLRTSAGPLVITQRGRPTAVMLDLGEYERAEREREILRALARGEREIATGRGLDLDDVLRDADALLRGLGR